MDPEEPLDYGDEDYGGGAGTKPHSFPGAIQALADDDDPSPEDEDYDDLYNDVNVSDSFMRSYRPPAPAVPRYHEPEAKVDPPPPAAGNPAMYIQPAVARPRDAVAIPTPVSLPVPRPPSGGGPTTVFVGDLHWWTTDADVEGVVSRYGSVKEIKFFEERASGKSKGFCQVDFYNAESAAAVKERVNGHVFHGRACVVEFSAPHALRQMSNRSQPQQQGQGRRMMNDGTGRGGGGGGGMNYQGRGGNWGRGNQGMHNRNHGGGGPRGRGNMGGRNMGGPGMGASVDLFRQSGLGPAGGILHAPGIMGPGFDPAYMARGGPYGGFASPAFPGMMPPFQAMNPVGLPGVAPHVNPAFFGRGGIPPNGLMMMGGGGMEGQPPGMWPDPSMGGWNLDDRDDGASDYDYGEVNHERGGEVNHERGGRAAPSREREKDRVPDRDRSGNSERRHYDEREQDWDRTDRERFRDDKDGYRDHRQRDRVRDNEEDWQNSLRSGSRPRTTHEEDHRSNARDADYGKRRRGD